MSVVDKSKPYRVGRSRTGLGLFATEFIPKGTRIIRYKGPMLNAKQAEEADNLYLFEISGKWTIDGSPRKNIARYANHSCRPNAESDVQKKKRRVYIRAIKNIEPGEEITYDYGTDYFKTILKPLGCLCVKCEEKRKAAPAEARGKKSVKKTSKKTSKKTNKKAADKTTRKASEKATKASKKASEFGGIERKNTTGKKAAGKSAAGKAGKKSPGKKSPGKKTAKAAGEKLGSKAGTKSSGPKARKTSTRASSLAKKKPRSKPAAATDGGLTQAA